MKRLITLIVVSVAVATSQDIVFAQVPYQYNHLIETGLGWTGATTPLVGVYGDNRMAWMNAVGTDIRYSYFFHDNWGVYGGLHLNVNTCSRERYLSEIQNRNSDQCGYAPFYQYRCPDNGLFINGVSVGVVSRYAWGNFSIMPRLGIGYGDYNFRDYRYLRYDNAECTGRPMIICREYDDGSSGKGALDLYAGIQFNYSVSSRVFLFMEGSVNGSPCRVNYKESSCYAVETGTEETVLWFVRAFLLSAISRGRFVEEYCPWQPGDETGVIMDCSRPIGCRINARAGVGIYLGRRKN